MTGTLYDFAVPVIGLAACLLGVYWAKHESKKFDERHKAEHGRG